MGHGPIDEPPNFLSLRVYSPARNNIEPYQYPRISTSILGGNIKAGGWSQSSTNQTRNRTINHTGLKIRTLSSGMQLTVKHFDCVEDGGVPSLYTSKKNIAQRNSVNSSPSGSGFTPPSYL